MTIPDEVLAAIKHVQSVHPEVIMVVFNLEGRWCYMDDEFNTPKFDDRVDVGVLEDAADVVTSPAIYFDPEYYT